MSVMLVKTTVLALMAVFVHHNRADGDPLALAADNLEEDLLTGRINEAYRDHAKRRLSEMRRAIRYQTQ
jgi:hypothetical protein